MFKIKKSYNGLYKLIFIISAIIFIHLYIKNSGNYLLMFILFLALGVLYYYIIMVVHELIHKTFIPNKKLNEFLGHTLSPLVGLNFKEYREQHLNHHWAKTVEEDPDAYIYLPVLKEKTWSKRLKVFILGSFSEFFTKLKMKSIPKTNKKFFDKYSVLISQLILLFSFFTLSKPLYYFIFWLGPIITISFLLNRVRVLIEHGYGFEEKENTSPQITVNVKANFLERAIFAPHNFNYHQIHHSFPGIPYYQLPQFYKENHKGVNKKSEQSSYISMLAAILFKKQKIELNL